VAPPDREDYPRDDAVLRQAGIGSDSRLLDNAAKLTSWLEWLLHPEEHQYDRTVYHPGGHKREEPGPVAPINDQPGTLPPDAQLEYESVLAGYQPWQFLHGMAAVAGPQVERPNSMLALGAVTLNNIWWVGDKRIASLVDGFPQSGWKGDAADAFWSFLLRLQTVAGQINKLVKELHAIVPKYAVVIKGVRDGLDQAAAGLVAAFEKKFASRPEAEFSVDVKAAVLSGIAAAAVAIATGGSGIVVELALVGSAWSTLFTDVASDVLKMEDDAVGGYWWRDLAHSYLHKQAEILTSAQDQIDKLNRQVEALIAQYNADADIQSFLTDYAS
jgi:uncharacterized protein YukE